MHDASHSELRREIDQLGRQFGEVIKHHAGPQGFELVEHVRALARKLHEGDAQAGDDLRQRLASLSLDELGVIVRSFTIFLELANLAEDRQRVRVIRARERAAYPEPREESIGAAIATLHDQGLTTNEVQELLKRVGIELVFTAHPTEAKRRSVRRILRRIRDLLEETDSDALLPRETDHLQSLLQGELHKLWQTDFVRPWRPTVLQEVERGLAIMPVLWSEAPALLSDLRDALRQHYPKAPMPASPMVRFGSWIGGDRDGNPFVTPEVTRQTLELLRHHAVAAHRAAARRLARSLSISDRLAAKPAMLEEAVARAGKRWPALVDHLAELPPQETYRHWMHAIGWRLRQTLNSAIDEPFDERSGAYRSGEELAADVRMVADCLRAAGDELVAENEVQPWLDQIQVFGLHTARLDLRQHSEVYHQAVDELWQAARLCDDPSTLDPAAREALLIETLASDQLSAYDADVSDTTRETLDLFALVRRTARQGGMAPLGAHVLSMTHTAGDILAMLWLWRWSECVDGGHPRDSELHLPLAPLFETIDDLDGAAETLRAAFSVPAYRDYLAAQDHQQMVMVGYSDSTKDGGYLAAQWALHGAQVEMQHVADQFGVQLTFFHGRGGSLGRGGGPAARSILSLPSEAFSGCLRLTEQGEVLAERYGTPAIAYRHTEQICWSTLIAAARKSQPPRSEWYSLMQQLAKESLAAYRQFVDAPGFGEFYRAVTPIDEIERLPMGSRPSKRKASDRIEDLRAIPWVFSWTQCRALLPAWYGLGSAAEALIDDPAQMEILKTMYHQWPFFRATISNAELALAKANMPVFRMYGELGSAVAGGAELTQAVIDEYQRSTTAVCKITGSQHLLDDVPWLQRSIQVRNRYVDPLNVVQVVLLTRFAEEDHPTDSPLRDDLEHLVNLNINGVSAGMRTTG